MVCAQSKLNVEKKIKYIRMKELGYDHSHYQKRFFTSLSRFLLNSFKRGFILYCCGLPITFQEFIY